MQLCESCEFIRLAESMVDREQLMFSTCKCSKKKNLARISEMFHAEEMLCQVLREKGDTCDDYLEVE